MKRIPLILLMLAVLLLAALPAVGQEEGQEIGPDEVVSQILGVFRSLTTNPRDFEEEIKELVVVPEGLAGRPAMPYMSIFMFYLFFAGDTVEPAVVQEETATVTVRPEPIQLVLVQQEGRWKLDPEATYASLPESIHQTLEPLLARARGQALATASLSNLREIALAGMIFANDHDGRLPQADTWMDDLAPYVRSEQVFKSPLAPDLEWGYAMNEALAGMDVYDLYYPTQVVLFFESDLGTRNAAGGLEAVPDPPRNELGNAFAFADVRGIRSREIPNFAVEFGAREREKAQQNACLSNTKELALAALMFAADHDDKLPDADRWMDQILPYTGNEAIFKCPAAPDLEYGYAMNAALSGVGIGAITNRVELVLFFESNLGTRNAAGGPEAVCQPGRHMGANNYAFLDGHCKQHREIPNFTPEIGGERGAGGPPPPAD